MTDFRTIRSSSSLSACSAASAFSSVVMHRMIGAGPATVKRASVAVRPSLQLPRGEAPRVDVVLVQAGRVVTGELDLELHLLACHGELAHRAWRPDAGASPGAVRVSVGKLAVSNHDADFLAQGLLVHQPYLDGHVELDHMHASRPSEEGQARCQGGRRPVRLLEARWKAPAL